MAVIVSSQDISEIELISDHILHLSDGHPVSMYQLCDIGHDRSYNVFELSCSLPAPEFLRALADISDLKVQALAGVVIVCVPTNISGKHLLTTLLSRSAEIRFFRDVSRSSRGLFDVEAFKI